MTDTREADLEAAGLRGTEIAVAAEQGARSPGPLAARLLFGIAVAWSLFQLWYASPLPFIFHVFILSDTQARPIHLAFAAVLAFAAFPGIIARHRLPPFFGVAWAIAGLALAAYAAFLAFGGVRNAPVFATMAVLSLAVAWMAWRPHTLKQVPTLDWLLAGIAALSALYLVIFYRELAARPGSPTVLDLVAAGAGIVLLLEATRRTLGPALMIIALVFLGYTFAGPYMPDVVAHRGASFQRAMSQQWLSAEGVFGIAIGVSTSFVFLFVLFGALLDRAGAGNYFTKLSFALLGHLRGGPAKAAVVSSGLNGLVSGSSIANVVTGGIFTIPLMRRVGYSAIKAGAIEVAASVNGQIMPPVMGAAAFLIAEYCGIPYTDVVRHAFLPAIATYISLFYIVHIEALKAGIEGLPRRRERPLAMRFVRALLTIAGFVIVANVVYYAVVWIRVLFGDGATTIIVIGLATSYVALCAWRARYPDLEIDDPNAVLVLPDTFEVLRTGLHFLLPIVVLVWCLMIEYLSPGLSAFWAVVVLLVIVGTQDALTALFRRDFAIGRHLAKGLVDLTHGLRDGAVNMIGIAIATATAGIIVGTISLTGVGLVLTEVVEILSGGNLYLMLALTAVFCLILGLGLPTTANYIIVATLMAPVLVQLSATSDVAVPLIAAHLFVFYFGLMADVTPPVGLASFAAAAISGASPLSTGVQAFRYEIRTGVLPFVFIFNNELLLIGIANIYQGAAVVAATIIGLLVFVAATQHWMLVRSRWWETAALALACLILFRPGLFMDRIAPAFVTAPPSAFVEVVEETPVGAMVRFRVSGLDINGNPQQRIVALPLDDPGAAEARLTAAGLTIGEDEGAVVVADVRFNSPAERAGLNFGDTIVSVDRANERPPKELFYILGLAIAALVYWSQKTRRDHADVVTP